MRLPLSPLSLRNSGKIALVAAMALGTIVQAADVSEGEQLFVQRVLPVLKTKCFACHGADDDKVKAEFILLTREGMLRGGESGKPALVPGKAAESPLYLAVTREHEDWEAMPPKDNDRLTVEQIGEFKVWIEAGAPWPEAVRIAELVAAGNRSSPDSGVAVSTSGGLSKDWTNRAYQPENLWAYQPLVKPAVPSGRDGRAVVNPIDAFLDADLAKRGLAAAPSADRRTLLRRVTFDLIGLPPAPEEVKAFLADPRSDEATLADAVERLLASPHYGERWARHWLDVVRYADSSGFANDYARGNAWRYRDYVIRAFNADKPYNQFVREQIAGDEIAATREGAPDGELLVATGFLRMGPWELTAMEVPKVARQRFLDDATDITGQVFLGQMLQCARCHDHKFDPIPTRDYYRMQAVFATTQLAERDAPFLGTENREGFDERKYLEQRREEQVSTLKALDAEALQAAGKWFETKGADRTEWDAVVAEVRQQTAQGNPPRDFTSIFDGARSRLLARQVPEDRFPPKLYGFTPEELGRQRIANKALARLRWEFDRYQPVAHSVYSGRTPTLRSVDGPLRIPPTRLTEGELEQTAILGGGDVFSPTTEVSPGALSVVDAYTAVRDAKLRPAVIPDTIEGRRLALADWIVQPTHPLTARVIVNRIWQWHFGYGLVGNPNNFGATGRKPVHAELLDWLAVTFVEQGWSIKTLHRTILSSAAYRRSASHPEARLVAEKDPDGVSGAVFRARRLTAEEMRDGMLKVSGELNPVLGGIPVRPEINLEAALQPRQVMGTFAEAWVPSTQPSQRHRRSIYELKLRGQADPFMEVFNAPASDLSCEARDASTITPQVFSLFNGQSSHDRSLAFAARVKRETNSKQEAIGRAFELAFGRAPTVNESAACLRQWTAATARQGAIAAKSAVRPRSVVREAVEENTGEKFSFTETLHSAGDFVADLQPSQVDAETRGLAEVCLVLLNANEFVYVY